MTTEPKHPESSVVARHLREYLRHRQQWRLEQTGEDELVQEL